jgi:hypothetical protein
VRERRMRGISPEAGSSGRATTLIGWGDRVRERETTEWMAIFVWWSVKEFGDKK